MIEKITILTDSINTIKQKIKKILRIVKYFILNRPDIVRNLTSKNAYGGHFAVTRSLINGLCKNGISFNYNPKKIRELADTVVVLSDLNALKQAIRWKRQGRIKRLLAGPNLVVFSSDAKKIITAKEIDDCLVNCDWVYQCYLEDVPEMKNKLKIWPAGVDSDYWKPIEYKEPRRGALIFVKNGLEGLSEYCEKVLTKRGFSVEKIFYGRYLSSEYLFKLQNNDVLIYLSKSESQGLAIIEAWSVDVPAIVWNPGSREIQNKTIAVSSAPYLNAYNGVYFSKEYEFEDAVCLWEKKRPCFSPRKWVLENMSDEICARKLCQIAGFNNEAC